jgi:hypothetical protein
MENKNINLVNQMLDKFVRSIYGFDMYLTSTFGVYTITVILYPNKFLLNSPEYDPEYASLMNNDKVIDIFEESSRYLGIDLIYERNPRFVVSNQFGSYLEEYIRQIEELTPDFFKSEYFPEKGRDDFKNITVKYQRVWFDGEPSAPFELMFKARGIDSLRVNVYDTTTAFKDELNEYLSSKMSVDPQITLFFHNS